MLKNTLCFLSNNIDFCSWCLRFVEYLLFVSFMNTQDLTKNSGYLLRVNFVAVDNQLKINILDIVDQNIEIDYVVFKLFQE